MNTLIRCPHCEKMVIVSASEDWQVGETLFTLCEKCDKHFMVRKTRDGLKAHRDLPLPKPKRSKLQNALCV